MDPGAGGDMGAVAPLDFALTLHMGTCISVSLTHMSQSGGPLAMGMLSLCSLLNPFYPAPLSASSAGMNGFSYLLSHIKIPFLMICPFPSTQPVLPLYSAPTAPLGSCMLQHLPENIIPGPWLPLLREANSRQKPVLTPWGLRRPLSSLGGWVVGFSLVTRCRIMTHCSFCSSIHCNTSKNLWLVFRQCSGGCSDRTWIRYAPSTPVHTTRNSYQNSRVVLLGFGAQITYFCTKHPADPLSNESNA